MKSAATGQRQDREDRPMTPGATQAGHTDEIEQATDEFPLLGYTVIASLKGIEIQHDDLATLLGVQPGYV